jgi:glutamate synthase domain-containing protein 1
MCGIVGIFSKSATVSAHLGVHVARMLEQMESRGPDSAGVAVYRDTVETGASKLSLYAPGIEPDWADVEAALSAGIGVRQARVIGPRHALFVVDATAADAQQWVDDHLLELHVISAGQTIEIYKDAITPTEFIERFDIEQMQGSHALGHTRMATESRVTAEGSHPFTTGLDLCLVHNGSLSNHNQLRRQLRSEGIHTRTENDSEVAAGYLGWRMREGDTLDEALESCLEHLDGFYTFAVGTADGFAVLRDPIACKPAVMAETDDWVAMATEYRALATLPGAGDAEVWEPEPARVYSWGKAIV